MHSKLLNTQHIHTMIRVVEDWVSLDIFFFYSNCFVEYPRHLSAIAFFLSHVRNSDHENFFSTSNFFDRSSTSFAAIVRFQAELESCIDINIIASKFSLFKQEQKKIMITYPVIFSYISYGTNKLNTVCYYGVNLSFTHLKCCTILWTLSRNLNCT